MIVAYEQHVFGEGLLDFTITAVNPVDHEQDIKQLFVTHERPEFPGFFDRAYPAGVRAGGLSWVGRDRAGQIVMHVACFPQRFRFGLVEHGSVNEERQLAEGKVPLRQLVPPELFE